MMVDFDTLPDGLWKSLFPKALSLIDEIREHGTPDPFFTFGGGTVLMLRYEHRLSKDIDIFVPDPQSLGYVSPRLSDVADTLCNSQYAENATYVKLQLPEGEIDFVASPNLLASAHAFERWELFGESVRVETAAEIVAKKMFHRGDKATARDLFDMALVIEREPAALIHAQPFFHRHADIFKQHVSSPSEGFVQQFLDIDTRSYNPTFEHAAEVAVGYLTQLQQDLEKSAQQVRQQAQAQGYTVQATDTAHGEYVGKVVHATSHHLLQHLGRNSVAIHEKHRLPVALHDTAVDTSLHLRYGHGAALSLSKSHSTGIER